MYRRFLNKNDYLGIITEDALSQLTRGKDICFVQAEQAAEASIMDYLTENYEIERELNRGKFIFEYDRRISYPIGCHFYLDGEICEVIQAINGYKAPCPISYWHETEEILDLEKIEQYSQMKNYRPGDVTKFLGRTYICDIANGIDFNDIRIPEVNAWEMVDTYKWDTVPYNEWEVVEYEGKFFTLLTMDNYDCLVNPMESDCWGMIGEYDPSLNSYELSEHEYVEYKGKALYKAIVPAKAIEETIKLSKEHHFSFYFESNDFIYVLDRNEPRHVEFAKNWGMKDETIIDDFDPQEIEAYIGMIVINSKEDIPVLVETLSPYFDIQRHQTGYSFDLTLKGVSKAVGIKKLVEALNKDMQDTIAFGDGRNDLEMLEEVNTGVAMGNAVPEAKAVANEVCQDVINDGITLWLKEHDFI